jgi:hypothetical protein
MTCEECGQEIPNMRFARASKRFCTDRCRYRHRDRLRYERDPEGERARSRTYYAKNRGQVARMRARAAQKDGRMECRRTRKLEQAARAP